MRRVQSEPRFKDGWGETIKDIREHRGYTIKYVADRIGVSKTTVSRWEKEIMIPELRLAVRLADVLKVDLETIFMI